MRMNLMMALEMLQLLNLSLVLAPEDIKSHRIRNRHLAVTAVIAMGEALVSGPFALWTMASFVPGCLLLLISATFGEQLGRGDAWLFVALGFSLDPEAVLLQAQNTFLLAGVLGLVELAASRGKNRGQEMALVPLVAAAKGIHVISSWSL